jgi:hypothetical protein
MGMGKKIKGKEELRKFTKEEKGKEEKGKVY